jgi:antitoxin component YwqK of YwqJK toxin-antitoxin module
MAETLYDENGKETSSKTYEYNDAGQLEEAHTFDAEGKETERVTYDEDGKVVSTINYSYSEDGRLESSAEYNADGKLVAETAYFRDGTTETTEFQYNDKGVLASSSTFDSEGHEISRREYDENGEIDSIKTWRYSADGESECVESRPPTWRSEVLSDVEPRTADVSELEPEKPGTHDSPDPTTAPPETPGRGEPHEPEVVRILDDNGNLAETKTYVDGHLTESAKYDDDGHVTERTTYDDKGEVESLSRFIYDKDGDLVSQTTFNGDGKITDVTTYGDDGKPVSSIHWTYDEAGRMESRGIFGEHGQELSRVHFDDDGKMESTSNWVYNQDGKPIMAMTTDFKSGEHAQSAFNYGADGKLDSIITTDPRGHVLAEVTVGDNGHAESVTTREFDPQGRVESSSKFDANGHEVERTQYNDKGQPETTAKWTYDDKGNVSASEVVNAQGQKVEGPAGAPSTLPQAAQEVIDRAPAQMVEQLFGGLAHGQGGDPSGGGSGGSGGGGSGGGAGGTDPHSGGSGGGGTTDPHGGGSGGGGSGAGGGTDPQGGSGGSGGGGSGGGTDPHGGGGTDPHGGGATAGDVVDIKDADGDVVETRKYDANGNEIQRVEYDDNGKVESTTDWTYDKDGDLASSRTVDADGRVTAEAFYDEDGNVQSYKTYEYNEAGKLVEDHTYNKDGREILRHEYNEDGKIESSVGFSYNPDGQLVSSSESDADGNLKASFTYDAETGKVTEWKEFTYENGKEVKVVTYDGDGKVQGAIATHYGPDGERDQISTFDANGNETLRETIDADGESHFESWSYNPDGTLKPAEIIGPDGERYTEWLNEDGKDLGHVRTLGEVTAYYSPGGQRDHVTVGDTTYSYTRDNSYFDHATVNRSDGYSLYDSEGHETYRVSGDMAYQWDYNSAPPTAQEHRVNSPGGWRDSSATPGSIEPPNEDLAPRYSRMPQGSEASERPDPNHLTDAANKAPAPPEPGANYAGGPTPVDETDEQRRAAHRP